jgi:hypothetical protein
MLSTADLMYKTDHYLVKKLNVVLGDQGLQQVEHVLTAIYRLGTKFMSVLEKETTRTTLVNFFMCVAECDEDRAKAIMDQWPKCWEWQQSRLSFAHPLMDAEVAYLQEVKV